MHKISEKITQTVTCSDSVLLHVSCKTISSDGLQPISFTNTDVGLPSFDIRPNTAG
jgi:hypothetical protein